MTIDLTEFYQTFFEEASEHLAEMENLLINMDVQSPDLDELNAIFRAAHSIKGGSGMFGFTEMIEVTHILETLLDRLRKGELQLTEKMVDAFLLAQDILTNQIAFRQGGPAVEQSSVDQICALLQQLASNEAPTAEASAPVPVAEAPEPVVAAPEPPPQSPAPEVPAVEAAPAESQSVGDFYDIEFSREGNQLGDLAPFDWLIDSLKALGQFEVVNRGEDGKPALFKLSRSVAIEEINDIFAFFVTPDQVKITTSGASAPTAVDEIPPDSDFGFFAEEEESDPSYGLFTDDEHEAVEEDESYGLFDETALFNEAEPEAVVAAPIVEPAKPEPVEVKPVEVKAPEAPVVSKVAPAPVKEEVKAPAPTPVAKSADTAAAKPAAAAAQKATAQADSSIRVNVEKVDQLINLVGELVITQAMLAQTATEVDPVEHENLFNGISLLERNTRDLQEAIMSIRMMPMSFVFSRFPRMVRDLAGKLNKEINFKTQGEGTELDKGLIEKITDPLTHLVRNSLDHGIETPEVRIQRGKDPKGNITMRAFHQGGNVVIEVEDDGGGLNREKILNKARERGLAVSDSMSDAEVWLLIMAPGFSTADVVTDVSGRGVGMDVVKKNIESMGGRVEIDSREGKGTKMTIRLPLTLAILDGLSIAVGDEVYIIPITSIIESLQPSAEHIKTVAGAGRMVHVRGEYLPLIALYDVFATTPRSYDPQNGTLMIVEADGVKGAVLVDELLGQHQVVIKSLESNYRKVPGISGATIMGDGRVALILDVTAVVRIGMTIPCTIAPPDGESVGETEASVAEVMDSGEMAEAFAADVVHDACECLTQAVAAHTKWKTRLRVMLQGKGENLDASVVSKDSVCDLGKWIYGTGKKYEHIHAYGELKTSHAKFHRCAGDVVKKHASGDDRGGEKMLDNDGAFSKASAETVKAINKLKKELERLGHL